MSHAPPFIMRTINLHRFRQVSQGVLGLVQDGDEFAGVVLELAADFLRLTEGLTGHFYLMHGYLMALSK